MSAAERLRANGNSPCGRGHPTSYRKEFSGLRHFVLGGYMIARVGALLLALSLGMALGGCGGSTDTNRQLVSITVSPSSATAAAANGSVQFSATGTYSDGEMVSPLPVLWSVGNPFQGPPVPCCGSVNETGLAQCNGATGGFQITATAPVDPNIPLSDLKIGTKSVSGSGQLSCQ